MEQRYAIELRDIVKSYVGVPVLKGVSFCLEKGEIQAFVGQNGAGKSTLMKILSGSETADSGDILVNGVKVDKLTPAKAEELGIGIVHQELALCPDLTVAENVFLAKEPLRRSGLIDQKRILKQTSDLFATLHIQIDPKEYVRNLSVADQQMVEIAKAVQANPKILIFDEPTASLNLTEVQNLFKFIRMLKQNGVSMVYISHRLNEIFEIADRITVLRDGYIISSRMSDQTNMESMVHDMVGKDMSKEYPPVGQYAKEEVVLELQNISLRDTLKNINLNIRKGEVVALAGLVGAGQREIANVIFGIEKPTAGKVIYKGKAVKPTPQRSVESGVAFLTESRKKDGLFLEHSILFNTTISNLREMRSGPFISARRERQKAKEIVESISLKYDGLDMETRYLSGGNQQKVVVSKWLCGKSDLFIFSEPTRGIDISAKYEIYQLMQKLASEGKAILVISSDNKELLGTCNRMYVVRQGQIVKELDGQQVTEEEVMLYAAGGNG